MVCTDLRLNRSQKLLILLKSSLEITQILILQSQISSSNDIGLVRSRPVALRLECLEHQAKFLAKGSPDLLVALQGRGDKSRTASGSVDPSLQVLLHCALRCVQESVLGGERHARVCQDCVHEDAGVVVDISRKVEVE